MTVAAVTFGYCEAASTFRFANAPSQPQKEFDIVSQLAKIDNRLKAITFIKHFGRDRRNLHSF